MPSSRILVSRNRSSALLTLETHALHPTPRDSRLHINVSTSHDAERNLVFSAFAVMNPMVLRPLSVIYNPHGLRRLAGPDSVGLGLSEIVCEDNIT
jgi:hypothetical protein